MSAAAATEATLTSQEYIKHHLTNLTVGEGFWSWNLDSLGWSVFLGLVFLNIFLIEPYLDYDCMMIEFL